MNTRINLLTRSQSYSTLELYFKIFRIATYILLISFFIFASTFFVINQNKKQELNTLLNKKQEYLNYFLKMNANEAEFVYFSKKEKQLKDFLKEDIRLELLPYYRLLANTVQSMQDTALASSKINIDRSVSFEIKITNYNSLYNIFKFIESDEFLSKFEELKLNNFSASEVLNNDYKLGFSGRLKELKGNLP